MFRSGSSRAGVSALALSLACVSFTATLAPAHAAGVQSFAFAIPAQDLGSALRQYSRVTGLQVAASADVVRGRRSSAV